MPRLTPLREQEQLFTQGVDADDWKYRDTGSRSRLDVPWYTQERMMRTAFTLYRVNPLASRILELSRDFVIGGGIEFRANEPIVEQLMRRHWESPYNLWEERLPTRILELYLFGELCLNARVNEVSGDVAWQNIPPIDIKKVDVNPNNYDEFVSVTLKPVIPSYEQLTTQTVSNPSELVLQVINYRRGSDGVWGYEGDCIYYPINRVAGGSRGMSVLFSLADWLDAFDQFLFNRLERSTHLNQWIWDITLEGATKEQIRAFINEEESRPTRPGSLRAHNEKVTWRTVEPKLGGEDVSAEARLFKNYIIGSSGFPDHFLGDSSVARAAAAELTVPTIKTLERRQDEIEALLRRVFNFVLDSYKRAGVLDRHIDTSFQIIMPRLALRDLQRAGGAIARLMEALERARANEWLDDEEGKNIFKALLAQIGLKDR